MTRGSVVVIGTGVFLLSVGQLFLLLPVFATDLATLLVAIKELL